VTFEEEFPVTSHTAPGKFHCCSDKKRTHYYS
jgi:hypothetical protein